VVINGINYGPSQATQHLAEALLNNLTPDQRQVAEVRIVTTNGQQILLG